MARNSNAFLQRSLTLRHLRLLAALDEMRHVSRVANALHVTQPAVSKALAEIESGVAKPLFERTPRGLVPTPHGACLARYAQIVLNEIARAGDELSGIERGITAAVVVGVMPGGSGDVLPAAIVHARQRASGLVVTVNEGPMELLLRQLRAGKLDLVLGALADRSVPADLERTTLYNEPLVVVSGLAHPLARARHPAWPALVVEPWLLPARGARLRDAIEAWWRHAGLAVPNVIAETVSLDLILDLLGRTSALALLPQRQARRLASGRQLKVLDAESAGIVLPICVLSLRDAPASSAVAAFKASLLDAAAHG